jgi:hypothetical protein
MSITPPALSPQTLAPQNLGDDGGRRISRKRAAPGRHVVQDRAEGEDIAARRDGGRTHSVNSTILTSELSPSSVASPAKPLDGNFEFFSRGL